MEKWKDIPGYGGHYQASTLGRIKAKQRVVMKPHSRTGKIGAHVYKERILAGCVNNSYGHLSVKLGVDKKKYYPQVHRLILLTFVGPAPDGMECRHLNGIPTDNRVDNLAWGTHKQNMEDRVRHGRYGKGENHVMAKLTSEQVDDIISSKDSGVLLAQKYGIGTSQVSRIRNGQAWQ